MRDQIVDVDLAVHVPVDDLRHVGAAARAAERRALPHAAGDELERARLDLLAGAGDADDHRDAPAAVAALERLAHHVDVADALEAVVGAAAGELDEVRHEIAPHLLRIHEVRHAELSASASRPGLRSTPTIMLAPTMRAPWITLRPMPPRPKTTTLAPGSHLGGVDHRADAGGDAAADVADLVERRVLADLRDRDLRQHREVRERRAAHVVMDRLAAEREAAGAVGHQALALRRADRRAEVGLARQAGLALPALGRVERDDVIALLQRWSRPGPTSTTTPAPSWPRIAGNRPSGIGARARELVGVADAGGLDLDQHLARRGPSSWTVSMVSGAPALCATAARTSIGRSSVSLVTG